MIYEFRLQIDWKSSKVIELGNMPYESMINGESVLSGGATMLWTWKWLIITGVNHEAKKTRSPASRGNPTGRIP